MYAMTLVTAWMPWRRNMDLLVPAGTSIHLNWIQCGFKVGSFELLLWDLLDLRGLMWFLQGSHQMSKWTKQEIQDCFSRFYHSYFYLFFPRPNQVKWQLMVASCHRRSGNYQHSLETYKSIHRKFPDNVECKWPVNWIIRPANCYLKLCHLLINFGTITAFPGARRSLSVDSFKMLQNCLQKQILLQSTWIYLRNVLNLDGRLFC
jgi:hypothetical protein